MIYLSGKVRADLPAMITPRMRQLPPAGLPWAADSGRFASPDEYDDDTYLSWLARMPVDRCLFATAPDVVADATTTLLLSAPMYRPIRQLGYPVALVAQDGLEHLREFIPWHDIDVLFIGGTTRWKLGVEAARLAYAAKGHGKRVHMGRVNSLRRLRYAASIGCDSADGTFLAFRPPGDQSVHGWVASVLAHPTLW